MTKYIKLPELSLVVLVGATGSGKSSFARKHFKPTEVISSDYCRSMVSDDENGQSCSAVAFQLLYQIASARLKLGKLAVIDATSVKPEDRRKLVKLAREYYVLPIAIVLDLPWQLCHERNQERPNRQFGKHVAMNHVGALRRDLKSLRKYEGFTNSFILNTEEEIDAVVIERQKLWNNKKDDHGPFDIIGDIHGCFDELLNLLQQLDYTVDKQDGLFQIAHPDQRKLIFAGDLVDRGPKTPEVIRLVKDAIAQDKAYCVLGNHDEKLKRALKGAKVKVAHGLQESLDQFALETEEFKAEAIQFLDGLISHYVFDDGRLAVAHAGIKEEYIGRGAPSIKQFCMYGETTGEIDEFGLPVRYPWAEDYRGNALIVYGHTPVPESEWVNNTINIDTGCVFGGKLTALRYPEKELVSVAAAKVYSQPVKPLTSNANRTAYDLLDINDVIGKRIIHTQLRKTITVGEDNAAAGLETMSRFVIDPRWLVYLPPTMAPTETSTKPNFLEHPEEAFSYFKNVGVNKIICEEKHMGSRAIVIVCKDEQAAAERFQVTDGISGVCYTRTGRAFFNDAELEQQLIAKVSAAMTKAGLWQKLETDWVILDCELMPWSAKAQGLLQQQYATVASAGEGALTAAAELLAQAVSRVDVIRPLATDFQERLAMLNIYRKAYQQYCWQVNGIADYKLAPFHILAHENNLNMHKDHGWHIAMIDLLCEADSGFLQKTNYRIVNINDENDCQQAADWWLAMTENGGEGMVVKPYDFTVLNHKGLVQPGIKCRGPEYLRIIYGPEYTHPNNLERLRKRGLGKKRNLALQEYALGYEALHRFVNAEPLHKVHECVFAVLALESEPVDPRL